MFRLCPVEIHHMQSFKAHGLKLACHLHRIVVIDGLLVVITFGQSYALSSDDVDGWYEFYLVQSFKFQVLTSIFQFFNPSIL